MFRIRLLWVGKTREPFIREGIRLYEKKVAKKYKTKMVLIITFFEFKLRGLSSWSNLYENIKHKLCETESAFVAVYLYNEASNEIYQAA